MPGNEQLPHAARAVRRHRVHAPVPAIEFADHADARGVRRPARRTARRATPSRCSRCAPSVRYACCRRPSLNRYRSSPLNGRGERIGIVQFRIPALSVTLSMSRVAPAPPSPRQSNKPSGWTRSMGTNPARSAHRDGFGVRLEYAQRPSRAVAMQSEQAKRIVAGAPCSKASRSSAAGQC